MGGAHMGLRGKAPTVMGRSRREPCGKTFSKGRVVVGAEAEGREDRGVNGLGVV